MTLTKAQRALLLAIKGGALWTSSAWSSPMELLADFKALFMAGLIGGPGGDVELTPAGLAEAAKIEEEGKTQ